MNNLDFQAAVKEIGQAVGYLLATGSPKVGITGFCMGGALSFAAGQHVPQLAAVAPCYGIPDSRYFQVGGGGGGALHACCGLLCVTPCHLHQPHKWLGRAPLTVLEINSQLG
jgi:hypothetical protein